MEPRIEHITSKKLVGQQMQMTLADDKTRQLWTNFMQRRKEILNSINPLLYSIQVYDHLTRFENFNLQTQFIKWAAIEVPNFDTIPTGMEAFTLDAGLYAIFLHKGAAPTAAKTFQYIFEQWLPLSKYEFDARRPQFEILDERYRNNDPQSEEDVYIPIKLKSVS